MKGSCLCGGVRYEVLALSRILHCHCSMCRKATGAAFRTRATVRSPDFRWLAGEHLVTRYESSPDHIRTFCRVCGSTLLTEFPKMPKEVGLPLGTLDDDPGIRPEFHIFVDSKAPWFTIHDQLPQHGALPAR